MALHPPMGWKADRTDALLTECLEHPESEWRERLQAACVAHPAEASELHRRYEQLVTLGIVDAPAAKPPRAESPGEAETCGPFRLIRQLGAGAMGVVHLAEDVRDGRRVALKILRPGYASSEHVQQRFRREMEAAGRLRHPNVSAICEVGVIDGLPFIAMEYVEGQSLAEWIGAQRARRTLQTDPPSDERRRIEQICAWGEQLADALQHTHEAGIVHRDVKPSNIQIAADDGRALLLDFGLAHAFDTAEAMRLTTTGEVLGTPAYMAPEQIAGKAVGPCTDVHGLGMVLYECLTLQHPFHQTTREAMFRAILETEPPWASMVEPAVPEELALVVGTALARRPAHRFGSAGLLAEELRRVRAREPIVTRSPGPLLRGWRWLDGHRLQVAALALGLACAVLVVQWLFGLWPSDEFSAAPAIPTAPVIAGTEPEGASPETLAERPDHLWNAWGDEADDQFGYSIALVDDLDGDGHADVVVGSPGSVGSPKRATGPGYVRVFSGRSGTELHTAFGDTTGDCFGFAVAGAGDVNADGHPDLVVGAIQLGVDTDHRGPGYVRVLSGRDFETLWTFPGQRAGDWFGKSVAAAGDLDRDGHDDILVGAQRARDGDWDQVGKVFAISGRTEQLILAPLAGEAPGEWLGSSVCSLGDVNGDGFPDIAAGAIHADPAQVVDAGLVRVFSGRDGEEVYCVPGPSAHALFGVAVAAVGDVDGDGRPDLLAGACGKTRIGLRGSALLFSGRNGRLIRGWQGNRPNDQFGHFLCSPGDLNLDGQPDIVVGSRWHDPGGRRQAGAVYLFSGANGSQLRAWFGQDTGDLLGQAVHGGGDVNGDGVPDLILGARLADRDDAEKVGRIHVFSGAR